MPLRHNTPMPLTLPLPFPVPKDIDSVLGDCEIPVFMTTSNRLVYLRKPKNRQVAKLPRKLKKRISTNLKRKNKLYRIMCMSLFVSEYERITKDLPMSGEPMRGLTMHGGVENWTFIDHETPVLEAPR